MILSRNDIQFTGFLRQNCLDLIYLVSQCLAQHMDKKNISLFHLVKVCKNLGTGKSTMSCQNCMSTFAAYRKAGAFYMTNTLFQYVGTKSMVDRKNYLYLRYLNTSHKTVTVRIKNLVIRMAEYILIIFIKSIQNCVYFMMIIIFLSFLPEFLVLVF